MAFFRQNNCRGFLFATMLSVIVAPGTATALVLDWGNVGWPGGSSTLTNTFANINGTNWSVQVQFTDPDSNLVQIADGNPASPSTGNLLDPPTNSGDNLFVRANTNGGGAGITIRFDFTHPIGTEVTDVVLSLFDVDTSDAPSTQWIDDISITGYAPGGAPYFRIAWFRQPERPPGPTTR